MLPLVSSTAPRPRTLIHPGRFNPVRIQSMHATSARHFRLALQPGRSLFEALVQIDCLGVGPFPDFHPLRFAIDALRYYLCSMRSFGFCLPIKGNTVPNGPDWLHEVKYDGYRLRLERDGDRVRLITRGGYDWTKRYPWIVEAARKVRQKQFVLDGEAVVLGVDGIADFNALHPRKHDDEVQFCAFDILAEGGEESPQSSPLDAQGEP